MRRSLPFFLGTTPSGRHMQGRSSTQVIAEVASSRAISSVTNAVYASESGRFG